MTRKITRAIARILAGQQEKLSLGTLEAQRDWGYAPEDVEAMWRMLQQDIPDDEVIGTGKTQSVKACVEAAFAYGGLDWQAYIEVDPRYFRPTEVYCLQADASKARATLGWEPRVTFEELIAVMVDAEMEAIGFQPIGHGQHILAAKFSGWHQWSSAVTSLSHSAQQTCACGEGVMGLR